LYVGTEENHDKLRQETCLQVCEHPDATVGQYLVRMEESTFIITILRRLVQR